MPKIYIDILIIVNFTLCFALLGITAKLTHYRLNPKRQLISSLVGAFSSMSVITSNTFAIIIIKSFFILMMLICAFNVISPRKILRLLVVYSVSNIVLTSVVYIFWYITDSKTIYIINYTLYFDVSLLTIIFSVTAAYMILSVFERLYSYSKLMNDEYKINVIINGKEFSLRGFADTGNMLKDCFTGKSVVVCKSFSMCKAFSLDDVASIKFRCLPYKTASGDSVMYVVKPDNVTVKCLQGSNKSIDVAIGIVDSDKDELAIFNPQILI